MVPALQERFVPVGGTELFVRETGSGTPVLFVHGMCGDADVWSDQVSRLSDRFRCVAYDRRGHTRSPFG
ncbi:MAG: alpha/beta fold hydrolase, partial [Solirubrobacterales bacterium]